MDITFVEDRLSWEKLAGPWNDLLSRSATDVPFLRFEFLRSWWATLGGGEWPDGQLSVAIARDGDGNLAGALPLFRTSARPGVLLPIGTSEVADYLDLVAPEPVLVPFARALLETISRGDHLGVDTLDLWNILETSPGGRAMAAAGTELGWSVERNRLKPCPQITLGGGWEGYLNGLDKKQRHELRRKMRRAAHTPGTHFALAGRDLELSAAVEAFLGLMVFDKAKQHFLTPSMHELFRTLAHDAARDGWLKLEFLMVDGRPAAGAFCFDYGDRLLIYNSGMAPDYQGISPGWALLGHLIQAAAEEGKTSVDFMRGDEEYKFRLGGQARFIERITLARPMGRPSPSP
jgi:CelD/BcsL family acetyltransferase involved in cellulose biosynthesis